MNNEFGVTHKGISNPDTKHHEVAADPSSVERARVPELVSSEFTQLDVVLLKMAIMVTQAAQTSHKNYLRELLLGLEHKALRIAAKASVVAILRGIHSLITLSNASKVETHILIFMNNNDLTPNEKQELQNIQNKIDSVKKD